MEANEDIMSEIKFKGKKIQISKTEILWIPMANVGIISSKRKYYCKMLVDSGADITLVPRSLGEFLGISFEGKKILELRGIGEGALPYVVEKIKVKIGKHAFEARIGISMVEEIPLILGRLDIFDNFNIEFKQKAGVTIFCKVGKRKFKKIKPG